MSLIRLSELLSSGRRVPFPQRASTVNDENRQRRLEVMAQNELALRRTHCAYLGVKVRPGRFEEGPHKWRLGFDRPKSEVTFEWPNVIDRDGSTYRTSVRANHASWGSPRNPLFEASASGINFTVDFAEALSKAAREKIDFVEDRAFNDVRYYLNYEKLLGLDWKPVVSFEEGLRKTIEWYKTVDPKWWDVGTDSSLAPHPTPAEVVSASASAAK